MGRKIVVLRNKKWKPNNSSKLWAGISKGQLLIWGQEFTETAKRMFGDEEYEFGYTFDVENTDIIIRSFDGDDILLELKHSFDWEWDEQEFKHFCDMNKIQYRFWSR